MTPEQHLLQNRKGKTFFGFLYRTQRSHHLAVIQHGFSGSHIEPHIRIMTEAYLKNGYDVLALDCTNSFNDADGTIEESTAQQHYEDLEDGLAWAALQPWYRAPFALSGHSLGGLSILLYAEKHPEKILHLMPASAVLSGALLEQAFVENLPDEYRQVRDHGFMEIECSYRPGKRGRRLWKWFEDLRQHDALPDAHRLTMPVLVVVGDEDLPCPVRHQRMLYDALPGPKTMHIIAGSDHCFQPKLPQFAEHMQQWLQMIAPQSSPQPDSMAIC